MNAAELLVRCLADEGVRVVFGLPIERIVAHPVRSETAKPLARAEVLTTGKGLLNRVAFVVAGAGYPCLRHGCALEPHSQP